MVCLLGHIICIVSGKVCCFSMFIDVLRMLVIWSKFSLIGATMIDFYCTKNSCGFCWLGDMGANMVNISVGCFFIFAWIVFLS